MSKKPGEAPVTSTGKDGTSRALFLSNPSLSIHFSASGNFKLFNFLRFWSKVPRNSFCESLQSARSNFLAGATVAWKISAKEYY